MSNKELKVAEKINGRAAMIGCTALALATFVNKTNLLEGIGSININSLWLSIGIYAS